MLYEGAEVRTNAKYFDRYGRIVYGKVALHIGDGTTVIEVTGQEGKAIYQEGDAVAFLTDDLELVATVIN